MAICTRFNLLRSLLAKSLRGEAATNIPVRNEFRSEGDALLKVGRVGNSDVPTHSRDANLLWQICPSGPFRDANFIRACFTCHHTLKVRRRATVDSPRHHG